ncbi:MAG: hypothetical protein HOQ24_11080 [Mycobacteriaceae bacterium]|nr:hypothetical protein [Mycobacteriaceae bacterium]
MKRGLWCDSELLYDNSREGVIMWSAITELGAAGSTVSRRCRSGGQWQLLLPGVVLLHGGPPTLRQRMIAALLYVGGDAAITGEAALWLHGIGRGPEPQAVHLLRPASRHRLSSGFAVVERSCKMPEAVTREGLRVVPLSRAVVDACRRRRDLPWCRALLVNVIQRGAATAAELTAELAAGSRRGSAAPREALAELAGGALSYPEIEAQKLSVRAGLPPMVWNRDIEESDGTFVAKPDGWQDGVGLAWEIDSFAHHGTPDAYEHTVNRRQRMESLGIVVVVHTPRMIRVNETQVVADLRSAYVRAAARPRPPIRLR